jgi:predicted nucleic acid-binding protein
MSDKFFLDTNIVVYSVDLTDSQRRGRARDLVTEGATSKRGTVSYQVIQEFVNVALKKFQAVVPRRDLDAFLQGVLFPMMSVLSSPWLFLDALRLQDADRLPWYDSLIVAAAMQARCKVLYTEDLQHGRRFGDLVVQNPFL